MLLVLNLIAVAGFVLFLAKCRPISMRSGDSFHEIRPRAEAANISAHSASPIQDAVLKRLSLLEDIVYRQLNGKDARGCHGVQRGHPVHPRGPCARGGRQTSWLPRAPFYSSCPVSARRPGMLERIPGFSVLQLQVCFYRGNTSAQLAPGLHVQESLPGQLAPSAETRRAAEWD